MPNPLRKIARSKIRQICSILTLSQEIVDSAVRYFKLALELRFTQGRPSDHVCACCVYVACRQAKNSSMLLDFADYLKVCKILDGSVAYYFDRHLFPYLVQRLPVGCHIPQALQQAPHRQPHHWYRITFLFLSLFPL